MCEELIRELGEDVLFVYAVRLVRLLKMIQPIQKMHGLDSRKLIALRSYLPRLAEKVESTHDS